MKILSDFWKRLSNRIILLFLLLTILPLISVSIFAYSSGQKALEDAVFNRLSTVNLLKTNEYSNWIDQNQKQLRIIAQDSRLQFYVNNLVEESSKVGTIYKSLKGVILNDHLQPQINESAGFIELSIIDAQDGKILISTNSDMEGKYRADQEFFIEGKKDTFVQAPFYLMPDEERVMFISTPILNEDNQIIAVLAGRVDLNEMQSIISASSGRSKSEETYLVNEANLFVTDSRFNEDAALRKSVFTEGVNNCLSGVSGSGYYNNYNNMPVVGVYDWMEEWHICIITEESLIEAFAATERLTRTIAIASTFSIVVALVVGLNIARSITEPINKLIQGADQIGQMKLGHHIDIEGGEELIHLATAFNQMSDSLKEADQENKNLVKELKAWSNELKDRVEERTIELQASNALSDSIINSMPGIFYLFDKDGHFRRWNKNLEQVTGYSGDEIQKNKIEDLFIKKEKAAVRKWIQATFNQGDSSLDALIESKDGRQIPYFLIGLQVELNDQLYVIGTGVETTELKKAEAALRESNIELTRSNEELERFAYISSHDLQEPLRMVTSYLQLLERRYKESLDDEAKEFIAFAVDGATRMKQLINDLLSFSRVGTRGKDLEPVSSQAVLDSVLKDLDLRIRETNSKINYRPLPMVMADGVQLKQVFQNLIGNAIKFSGDAQPDITVKTKRVGQMWEFSVIDKGIGIDPQFFDRIFIIFQRLHNSEEYEGTGIGLALCKKIIERHGGKIRVESKPGDGSTFYFTLPAADEQGENDGNDL